MTATAPHPALGFGAVTGATLAMWPGTLPRDLGTAVTATGVLVTLATIAGRAASRHPHIRGRVRADHRWLVAGLVVLVMAALAVANMHWQNVIRADLHVPAVDVGYPVMVTGVALAAYGALGWIPRLMAAALIAGTGVMAGFVLTPATSTAASPTPASVVAERSHDDLDSAAAAITRRWRADGGPAKAAVVIAVPTGSGWVDPRATEAMSARWRGDIDILTLQYASMPSWQAFVTAPQAAADSAIVLLAHVLRARAAIPGAGRIPVYLYGQSLGALGADRARQWAEHTHPGAVAGTLLSGVPADSIAPHSDSPRTVFANASDPVTRWSMAALWRPPSRPDDVEVIGTPTHAAPWVPVCSFVASSIDLLSALDGPPGVGHRYGAEQGNLG